MYARYWFSSAQKVSSRLRGSTPLSAMETKRSSHISRSSCETSSGLRHIGEGGHPETLCSGITRPSSRRKSRQFDRRDGVGLLCEVANPEEGDRVVGCALHQANAGSGGTAIAHRDADQNDLNAGEDSKTQGDPENLLAPAIFEQATENHQKAEKSALHNADAAIEGKHHGHDTIGTSLLIGKRGHDG